MSPTNLPSVKDAPRIVRPTTAQPPRAAGPLPVKQRDFLLLNIYVLAQNGFTERASALAEALHVMGDNSAGVTLARAVLGFFAQDWAAALACLDETRPHRSDRTLRRLYNDGPAAAAPLSQGAVLL